MRASRGSIGVWLAAGVAAAALLTPAAMWGWLQVAARPVDNLRIDGWVLPEGEELESALAARARMRRRQRLTLETGHHVWRPTYGELGARWSVREVLDRADRVGRSPNPVVSLGDWWKGAFGGGHELSWNARIADEQALAEYVERIRAEVDRLPVPGSFDPQGNPIDGLHGEALNVSATAAAIRRAVERGADHVKVSTDVTPPPRLHRRFDDEDPVASADVLMERRETKYNHNNRGRATNVELAAKKLDGQVVMPGDVLSFNAVVGKRTRERGFGGAKELKDGEVVDGVGGGVCQTAGTLHAAAFYAGLFVEDYQPHSRLKRFQYLPPGLDTMVAWPSWLPEDDLERTRDLKIRNPYPFPVVVKMSFFEATPYQSVLRAELWGASKPYRVEYSFDEVDRVPAGERVREVSELPAGERRVVQKPLDGLVIVRRRTIYTPTERKVEEHRLAYPPTPRVVEVGAS